MVEPQQNSLFSPTDLWGIRYTPPAERMEITKDALIDWKTRVFNFQQAAIGVTETVEQGTLFAVPDGIETIVDSIDPFKLARMNTEFWRQRVDDKGVPALYFVLDDIMPLLLYVGETVHSDQRWKGTHDCKRYLQNYVSAHRQHDLPVQVNTVFWRNAPQQVTDRQTLESALIEKYAPPFNKEQWKRWNTPFTGGKKLGS